METELVLTGPSQKAGYTVILPQKAIEKKKYREMPSLHNIKIKQLPKTVKKPYFKFYTVFKNETSITEVFTNNFEPFQPTLLKIKAACALHTWEHPAFFLPEDDLMFYGFLSRIRAMEFAKAGALKYIGKLIDEGERGYNLLLKYREVHYEDLNINLTDRNIRKLESALER